MNFYRNLTNWLFDMIKSGKLSNDGMVLIQYLIQNPASKNELADFFGKSKTTIQRWLEDLKKEGLVIYNKINNCWCLNSELSFLVTPNINIHNNNTNIDNKDNRSKDSKAYLDSSEIVIAKNDIPVNNYDENTINMVAQTLFVSKNSLIVILQDVIGERPFFKHVVIDAAKYTIRQVQSPTQRIKRGLKPIKNPVGYFKTVLCKYYENRMRVKAIQERKLSVLWLDEAEQNDSEDISVNYSYKKSIQVKDELLTGILNRKNELITYVNEIKNLRKLSVNM